MPKVKVEHKSTAIDMTAMCDVAFLLLTFFMLTSNFTQPEPIMVNTPSSISEIKIPERDVLMILVDGTGKVFMGMDGQKERQEMLKKMSEIYSIPFTQEEVTKFSLVNRFGIPIENMKSYLALRPEDRDLKENLPGIPADSTNNQLKSWIKVARLVKPQARIAIKADQTTMYPMIRNVMNTLQDLNENRYNLITSLEQNPEKIIL